MQLSYIISNSPYSLQPSLTIAYLVVPQRQYCTCFWLWLPAITFDYRRFGLRPFLTMTIPSWIWLSFPYLVDYLWCWARIGLFMMDDVHQFFSISLFLWCVLIHIWYDAWMWLLPKILFEFFAHSRSRAPSLSSLQRRILTFQLIVLLFRRFSIHSL